MSSGRRSARACRSAPCSGAGGRPARCSRRRCTGPSPGRDWILSRILWLSGLEPGRNRLGDVDSMRRYIYIHGTPDHEPMGVPFSHGCIRMRNADVCWLFDAVTPGTRVNLVP